MTYSILLIAHSWLRWVVLAAALLAFVRSAAARSGARGWSRADDRFGHVFVSLLDLQMLLGLILYFFASPLLATIRQHLSEAMRDDSMRYWFLEHPFGMLIAIALAHVGRARIKKAGDPRRKHRLAMIFFGLALVAIVVSLPWPGMTTGRPLIRF